jgi:N utilization substance protein B
VTDQVPKSQTIGGKRRARKLAVQALYQWLFSQTELPVLEQEFRMANNMEKVDVDYFCRLLYGVPKTVQALEDAFTPLLDRPIETLTPVERTVLRISTFELLHCLDIPYRVVLDESVSLAKLFGAQDGHRYVNGVLHHLAKQIRIHES